MDQFLDSSFLFASLFWGLVGVGYWIYGKRQSSLPCMLGGVAMIAASYFARPWWVMSLLCIGIGIGTHAIMKRTD
jgi:hypothetical protein